MQVIDASSRFSSIVVSDSIGIRLSPQKIQAEDCLNVVFGSVSQVISGEHFLIQTCQVSCFNRAFDTPNRLEIIGLFHTRQIENRHDVSSWNDQGMPGIDRMGVEDPHE